MSLLAVRALGRAEVTGVLRSWLVRAWLGLALIATIITVLSASGEEDTVSEVLGGWLIVYFIPSAIMAAVFGTAAITQDAEVAADSLLTRAVTRLDYVGAKLASRVGVVVAIHLIATLPMLFLARRWGLDDATTVGLFLAMLSTGAMLVFLTALGVFTGTVLRNLAFAVVVIMIGFAAEGLVFSFLGIRELSPTRVLAELPETIRGDSTTWQETRAIVAFSAASLTAAVGAGLVFQRREF